MAKTTDRARNHRGDRVQDTRRALIAQLHYDRADLAQFDFAAAQMLDLVIERLNVEAVRGVSQAMKEHSDVERGRLH